MVRFIGLFLFYNNGTNKLKGGIPYADNCYLPLSRPPRISLPQRGYPPSGAFQAFRPPADPRYLRRGCRLRRIPYGFLLTFSS